MLAIVVQLKKTPAQTPGLRNVMNYNKWLVIL